MTAAKRTEAALTDAEFDRLMQRCAPFEAAPSLCVAVSGGVDSMVLLWLAHRWVKRKKGTLAALTFDHGLRKESGTEAAMVADWCRAHGVVHETLSPAIALRKDKNLQATARAARYGAMNRWCHARGILHLLLAHHQDDQAETLLLRLGRGSGIDGLSAMPLIQETADHRLLRPLLGIPKARLAATAKKHRIDWMEDTSNQRGDYARNRVRAMQQPLAEEGLTPERLARTATVLSLSRTALEEQTAALLARSVNLYPEGYATLNPAIFRDAAQDIRLRAFANLLSTLGGDGYKPRLEQTIHHLDLLLNHPRTFTFCGCLFSAPKSSGDAIIVTRELNAAEPASCIPTHGGTLHWDKRFLLEFKPVKDKIVRHVGALGMAGYTQIRHQLPQIPALPVKAIHALPAVWGLEDVLEVPHMGYKCDTAAPVVRRVCFSPVKPLAGSGFYGNSLSIEE